MKLLIKCGNLCIATARPKCRWGWNDCAYPNGRWPRDRL